MVKTAVAAEKKTTAKEKAVKKTAAKKTAVKKTRKAKKISNNCIKAVISGGCKQLTSKYVKYYRNGKCYKYTF